MRIEARLDKDIIEKVKQYQKIKGFTRDRAYGELIEKGLEIEGLIDDD